MPTLFPSVPNSSEGEQRQRITCPKIPLTSEMFYFIYYFYFIEI